MVTDDQTRRESQVDDTSPEGGEDAGQPNEPDIEVSRDEGGAPIVEEGRKERRQREREEKLRKTIEEHNKPLMEQLTTLGRTVQNLNAALLMRQPQPAPAAKPEDADEDREYDAILERQGELYLRYDKAVKDGDITEAQRLQKEYNRLSRQAVAHVASKTRDEIMREVETRTAPREPEAITQAKQQFATVMAHEAAREYAKGLHIQEEAAARHEHRPIDQAETFRKCMKAAGVKFGLIREELPPARPSDQAKWGSPSPSSSGRGAPFRRPLSEAERGFAHAAFSELPEAEAEERWAKEAARVNPDYFRG